MIFSNSLPSTLDKDICMSRYDLGLEASAFGFKMGITIVSYELHLFIFVSRYISNVHIFEYTIRLKLEI